MGILSMRARILFLLLLLVTACTRPLEQKVAAKLAAAGLSQPMAQCMAERWVKRLSVFQLQEISTLADGLKDESGELTVGRFITQVRQLDDPEIVEVVTKSSLVCALTS
jgi:hypothetical protein